MLVFCMPSAETKGSSTCHLNASTDAAVVAMAMADLWLEEFYKI